MDNHTQKAFTLAHRASESDQYDRPARAAFRAIAHELWLAAAKPEGARHCPHCGRPARWNSLYCSDACKQAFQTFGEAR